MSALTQTGVLPIGVTVEGVVHREFTLKPAIVLDNIEAIDEVGSHNPVALQAAVMARQLTQLGTLKPADINYSLLCSMDPRDFNKLDEAAGELAKKALPAPSDSDPGSASGSPSSGSGSPGATAQS